MALSSLIVECERRGGDAPEAADRRTIVVNIVAHGAAASILLQHSQGEPISAMGDLQLRVGIHEDGERNERFGVVARTIISARTADYAARRIAERTGAAPGENQRPGSSSENGIMPASPPSERPVPHPEVRSSPPSSPMRGSFWRPGSTPAGDIPRRKRRSYDQFLPDRQDGEDANS